MAEEATTVVPVDAPAVGLRVASHNDMDASLRPAQPAPAAVPAVPVATNGETTEVSKVDEAIAGPQATTAVNPPDGDGTAEVAVAPAAEPAEDVAADGIPSSGKKEKRKSVGGVPEHKSKKLNKKKSTPTLQLEAKPGDFYWARLKGYPPWPAVICDEQMLPESLLASRPVSTTRPDGTLRDDFKAGGKNAKDRTFPVMFLHTNEFTWMINTSLTPLDPEECKAPPNTKMSNQLKEAWAVAAENHDLDYFKGILKTWQEEEAQFEKEAREREEQAAADAERKAQEATEAAARAAEEKGKKKSKSRKSKGGDDDVDMADADAPKSSKKRKNESDADGGKPKKTPKVTKLNAPKTPNGETGSPKKSSTKSKKKVVQAPKEEEEEEKPQMTEAERLQTREKAVLYLRHRLQKGFLSRDQAPQETEMAAMADFFNQLEAYDNLEPSIIRATKVHKVLKAIVKLSSIPKDEDYAFKKRSAAMLEIWNKRLESETESAPASAIEAPKADSDGDKMDVVVPEATAEVRPEKPIQPLVVTAQTTVPALETNIESKVEKAVANAVEDAVTEARAEEAEAKLDEKVGPITEVPAAPAPVVDALAAPVVEKTEVVVAAELNTKDGAPGVTETAVGTVAEPA